MNELIYRPQHKPEQELVDDFVVRLKEYRRLMDNVKSFAEGQRPQHVLLQGVRGMGKTTLMHRVFCQVQKDCRKDGLVPVIFSEEQYSVRRLYKLWEQIAKFLEDNEEGYYDLWEKMLEIEGEDAVIEEKSFELLKAQMQTNRHRLVLFIDNFGIMVDKFNRQEQQRLREILIDFPFIQIIGGSAVVLESFYKYDKPFFDFFKVMRLEKLSSEEVKTLLRRLGQKHDSPEIENILKNQAGRIESLRILTNGVPRTIVMLFQILLDNTNGSSIEDLKKLLDMVTPLYQHRMEDLSPQQQEIVDKLALNWDGMSVKELAQKTRMESKAISAQLNQLKKNKIVDDTQTTGKNKFYQLEERFFNIWYLMQYSPRSQQKRVVWLTKFLEVWCGGDGMENYIKRFERQLKTGEINADYSEMMLEALDGVEGVSDELRNSLTQTANGPMMFSERTFEEDIVELLPILMAEIMRWLLQDSFKEGFDTFKKLLNIKIAKDVLGEKIGLLLSFAIAKRQHHSVFKLFQNEDYQLKDRYKPIYYALMKRMEDEYPNEIRKMPRELAEPVESVLKHIASLEAKYNR